MDSPNARSSPIHESFSTKKIDDFVTPSKQKAIMEAIDHLFVSEKYQTKKDVEKSEACKGCQTFTSYKCHKCNDYYCSNDCQHPDWKKHEAKCSKSPSSKVKSPSSDKDTEADEKLIIGKDSSPFSKLAQQIKNSPMNGTTTTNTFSGRKSEPAMSKSPTKFRRRDGDLRHTPKRFSLSDTDSKPKDRRSLGRNNQNKKFPGGSSSSAEMESMSNSFSSKISRRGSNQTKESTNQRTFHTKTNGVNVERRKTKRVVFFYKEPDTPIHWVMNEDDIKEFESIHNTLAKECDGYECVKPEMGLVCGCKYSDEWYRARVIALQPKVRVHYIDYGNKAEVSVSLKKLPPEIKLVKNLVYPIEFDENAPEKYKTRDLSGKTLKVEVKRTTGSDVEVVDLASDRFKLESTDSEMTENDTKETSTTKKTSAMEWVKSDSRGVISFLAGASKIRYGLIIPEESEKETEVDVKQSKSLGSTELKPVRSVFEGDYVLVIDYDDQRRRGKVVSMLCSTYYVLLIDYGIVITVENVYQLPGRSDGLIHLGANVIIDEVLSSEKVKKLEKSLYQVTGDQDSEGRWPCELKETSSKEVIAKGYIQSPPEEGVTVPLFIPVESGSVCEMSVVTGVRSCYVRPLDEQAARKNLEMSVKMAAFLVQADPLTRPPEIGKMYAAKNKKDDCFHRAVVKSVKNDKYEVLFVDFGTVEKVGMKDLKPLPVSIKVVPFFAVEVTLSGITVERLSDSAKEYLDMLIEENLTLVLNFSEGESDEVTLTEVKSGIVVNEIIENTEDKKNSEDEGDEEDDVESDEKVEDENVPDWHKDRRHKDEDVVMKRELKLPQICTNTKYDLVLQYVDEHEFFSTLTFWMANTEDETFSQVSNLVNSKIGEYCCQEREPYRPREQEMCLALFEGDWYRALTLSVKNDNYEIFFVDFGNTCTLKPKAIRKMKREFMEYPAWAFKCIISCVGKLIGKPGLKRAVYEELKRRMNSVFKGVVVTKHEFEIYYVAIPEIEEILSA